jgi:hypothetical protein
VRKAFSRSASERLAKTGDAGAAGALDPRRELRAR